MSALRLDALVPPPPRRCALALRRDALERVGSSAPAEMRRRRRARSCSSTGFLRPRGDAPFTVRSPDAGTGVPPPPRRCARSRHGMPNSALGSSAPAEMRPRLRLASSRATRFLRPRGDAPVSVRERRGVALVPRPPRRCARHHEPPRRRRPGSSAPAEMRRSSMARSSGERWFLRPRGDAPPGSGGVALTGVVPPPPRRCASWTARVRQSRRGSSAPAEMRPTRSPIAAPISGFLRPRGDAPRGVVPAAPVARVPPPPRRCAPLTRRTTSVRMGSSAPAEMRPGFDSALGGPTGFLRPRGDAPERLGVLCRDGQVPPPPRRCAGEDLADLGPANGSSAPAEMRRRVTGADAGDIGFLRPRGDAPLTSRAFSVSVRVPPPPRRCAALRCSTTPRKSGSSAPAEMRRNAAASSCARFGFLRPRGDAPGLTLSVGGMTLVPPPPRRCAVTQPPRAPATGGSSAPAEMRPRRTRGRSRPCRFLRPRGDAPRCGSRISMPSGVPPPPRRCARSQHHRQRIALGSSAPAEMRPC